MVLSLPGDANRMHGASALDVADVDGDGDNDLIWGDFFSPSLYLLENDGACPAPAFHIATTAFPTSALRTAGYNAAAVSDVNGDGRDDLTVGVVGGAFGTAPIRNLHLLTQRDDGTFARVTDALVPGLDAGTGSAPAWGDLDGDGDADLIVGTTDGELFAWENVGTPGAPSLRAARLDLPALDGYSFVPTIADLDGDGLSRSDRRHVLGRRVCVPSNRRARVRANDAGRTPLAEIPRGNIAAPTAADVDGDGDIDLIVGESSGDLNLLRNDGTPSQPGPVDRPVRGADRPQRQRRSTDAAPRCGWLAPARRRHARRNADRLPADRDWFLRLCAARPQPARISRCPLTSRPRSST